MKRKDSKPGEPPPHRTIESPTRLVGLLAGNELQEVAFRLDANLRRDVELCFENSPPNSKLQDFVAELEILLGEFQILAKQEREQQKKRKDLAAESSMTAQGLLYKRMEQGATEIAAALTRVRELVSNPNTRLWLYLVCQARLTQETYLAALNSPDYKGAVPGTLEARQEDFEAASSAMLEVITDAKSAMNARKEGRLIRNAASTKGGRPRRPLPPELVNRLWDLVSRHFSRGPTTTRSGPFERLAGLCFQAVGWEVADINKLIVRAGSRHSPKSTAKTPAGK